MVVVVENNDEVMNDEVMNEEEGRKSEDGICN